MLNDEQKTQMRTALAIDFMKAMLIDNTDPSWEHLVARCYMLADEFMKQGKM